MTLTDGERRFLEAARVGRLATADEAGRPHVLPVCFALADGAIVTPIDEKPKTADPTDLRRVRDVEENPTVALVVDHYSEDWSRLGWLQVRGRAALVRARESVHAGMVAALRDRYDQYHDHALEERPILRIEPAHAISWGALDPGVFAVE